MRNIDACLYFRPSDRVTLERLLANGKTPQKIVARARIVLLSGRGFGTNAIQREARVSKPTVWRWQQAYVDGGVERLLKDRGKGACAGKKPISAEVRIAIVTRTAKEKPMHATHWSARMLAAEIGVGHTTVQRGWKEHGLKLSRPFKPSNDPKFAEKVVDIVGLPTNCGRRDFWPATLASMDRRRDMHASLIWRTVRDRDRSGRGTEGPSVRKNQGFASRGDAGAIAGSSERSDGAVETE
jgi:transposase